MHLARLLPWTAVLLLVVVLAACGGGSGDDGAETASPSPAGTPTPAATATATPIPDSDLIAELQEIVFATVPEEARGTPADFEGISGAHAFRIPGTEDLFAAVTVGRPNFNPFFPHFVTVYRHDGPGAWTEIAREDLLAVEFIEFNSLDFAEIEPSGHWLVVHGSVGVHGTSVTLVRFDGSALTVEVEHIADAPIAGGPAGDLTGDGTQEVVLDASNYYVFCYACGVVHWRATVLAWDGEALTPIEYEELPAPDAAAAVNNEVVALARAGRLVEAIALVDANTDLRAGSDTFNRNAVLIEQTLVYFARNASNPAYPLLHDIFAGDWANAAARLRQHDPAEAFGPGSALVSGTVAEGYEPQVARAITSGAEAALTAEPELAEIHLLRAWALSLLDPGDPAIAEALARAAELAPGDPYIADALSQAGG